MPGHCALFRKNNKSLAKLLLTFMRDNAVFIVTLAESELININSSLKIVLKCSSISVIAIFIFESSVVPVQGQSKDLDSNPSTVKSVSFSTERFQIL